ncbi:hypothetical protein DL95DRAFT_396198 [Leptodontidium sp. 2 PMI_412]|nr:hypothetical protein DL95DRAFT_396198 [Leptodontidium sp. 2 PMI_412]
MIQPTKAVLREVSRRSQWPATTRKSSGLRERSIFSGSWHNLTTMPFLGLALDWRLIVLVHGVRLLLSFVLGSGIISGRCLMKNWSWMNQEHYLMTRLSLRCSCKTMRVILLGMKRTT